MGFVVCTSLPVNLVASSPNVQARFRLYGTIHTTRAVLVVSHHLDGLLRIQACESIAPRYGYGVRCVSRFSNPRLPKQSRL